MAAVDDLPGVAPVAMQQGRFVARRDRGSRHGEPARPKESPRFPYRDKGTMATVGPRAARSSTPTGCGSAVSPARSLWAFSTFYYLIGWGNRLGAILNWARALTFTKNRPHRTITAERARHELTHDTGKDTNEA